MAPHDNANNINTFFLLLRSGLYGTAIAEAELPDSIDWKWVISLAKKHFVFGTIIESVQFLPENLRPSSPIAAEMSKFALGLIQTGLILDNTVARLVTFFNEHDVSGVLLKGQGVARYYRLPQMRQSGDIDFYVGNTVFRHAVDLCKQHLVNGDNEHGEIVHHYDFMMDGVLIEIHRLASRIHTPIRRQRFQAWVTEQLEHSTGRRSVRLGNGDVTLPSYDFDAIFIFQHAWHHYVGGGIGLRQLCDWAMIFHSHSADIDCVALKENIRRFGMTRGWKLFAWIAVNHLGVSAHKMPLYDPSCAKKAQKAFREIVAGGNFGYFTKAYAKKWDHLYGARYAWHKLRHSTARFLAVSRLAPVEATFQYLDHLYYGTKYTLRRAFSRKSKK